MGRKKNGRVKSGTMDYWQSYSDMMAALLFMFILIMSITLISSYQNSEKIVEQNKLLQEQKDQISKILGIKPDIVRTLKAELDGFDVNIDDKTGDIMFKSDILFDYNMIHLKKEGSNFLNGFMPKYLSVILDEKYVPYIAEIIIEGHTDNQGSYMYNLKLSQDRALSVAEFCIGEKNTFLRGKKLEQLRKIITVNGKAYSNPVYKDSTKTVIDAEKSRRVEVKFRLKDDETIEELQKILKD